MNINQLFLIDAVNFIFRSYYAIGPMTSKEGKSTGALYGFIRSLYKIIQEFSAEHLVAVFDGPDNKLSRSAIYSAYKSHRKGMPEDLFPQIEWALSFCSMAGIPTLHLPGVEADDVIGSVARWAESEGSEVFICTSDKDFCQLVSEKISLINVHKNNLLVDRDKVEELYGIQPEQIIDYLAIVGDASDNIPGLPGFGPKTASLLLQEFGTLDALLAEPERVKGAKKQEALREGREIALMSRELATIQTGLSIPHDATFYHLRAPQIEEVRAFFHEMHFLSLLKELESTPAEAEEEESYHLVAEESDLKELVKRLLEAKEVVFDTETTSLKPMEAQMVGIGFALNKREAWYVPLNHTLSRKRVLELIAPLFASGVGFSAHNIKYDLHVLLNEGLAFPKLAFDTMLASYLIAPQRSRHNLDSLSLEFFGKVKTAIEALIGKGKKQTSMAEVAVEKVTSYCCADVDYTRRLEELFGKELERAGVREVFETIELPLIPVLVRMERRGIFVDRDPLDQLAKELHVRLEKVEKEIYACAGEEFNLNSPKQLSSILFDKLGIKPPKKTTTGFSTSASTLESLKKSAPIVEKILDYRSLEKLRSTYAETLPKQIDPKSGRIHCTFNQSVAATGRLSCQDPNLQNIPIRSVEGRKIRAAFRPQKQGWSFLSGDYSQIELRILAHLSEDPLLLKAFNAGEDVHAFTAAEVFNLPLSVVTKEMRHRAKAVNFGILYGQQAFGLSKGLDINFQEAAAFIDTYFQRYKKVKEYLEFCKESALKSGRAVTLTGRQRPIPEIDSKNPVLRAAAERLAVNTPLQGTAADLIKIAMIELDALLEKDPSLGWMVLQIHDELLFESPDQKLEPLSHLVKEVMEGVFSLRVPLVVDISFGKNWEEC